MVSLSFNLTEPLIPGLVKRAIAITSLSSRGWVDEDIDSVRYDAAEVAVIVNLADRPINEVVRLIVRGTGRHRLRQRPAVPLAGFVGGPLGTLDDGVDAVYMFKDPIELTEAES